MLLYHIWVFCIKKDFLWWIKVEVIIQLLALLLSILSKVQLPGIAVAVVATVGLTLAWSGTAGILGGMIAGALAGVSGLGGKRAA